MQSPTPAQKQAATLPVTARRASGPTTSGRGRLHGSAGLCGWRAIGWWTQRRLAHVPRCGTQPQQPGREQRTPQRPMSFGAIMSVGAAGSVVSRLSGAPTAFHNPSVGFAVALCVALWTNVATSAGGRPQCLRFVGPATMARFPSRCSGRKVRSGSSS